MSAADLLQMSLVHKLLLPAKQGPSQMPVSRVAPQPTGDLKTGEGMSEGAPLGTGTMSEDLLRLTGVPTSIAQTPHDKALGLCLLSCMRIRLPHPALLQQMPGKPETLTGCGWISMVLRPGTSSVCRIM